MTRPRNKHWHNKSQRQHSKERRDRSNDEGHSSNSGYSRGRPSGSMSNEQHRGTPEYRYRTSYNNCSGRRKHRHQGYSHHWSQKRGRRAQHHLEESHVTTNATSAAESCGSSDAVEIPGFYYDAEKKKYFRILPGHAGNTNAVTKETVHKKEMESVRLKKINALESASSSCTVIHSVVNKRKSRNIYELIRNREVCSSSSVATDSSDWPRQCVSHSLSNLRPRGKMVADIPPMDGEAAKHCLQMATQHEAEQTHLLSVWSNGNGNFHRLQISEINSLCYSDEEKSIKMDIDHTSRGLTYFDIRFTNVIWAPSQTPRMCNVIYGAMSCFPGGCRNLVFLYMGLNEVVPVIHSYHLANHDLWCVAWNKSGRSFSAGCDKNTVLVDVETGRRHTLLCMNQNVYAQQFSQGKLLYSGTKSGSILMHDLRADDKTGFVLKVQHESCISHLQTLEEKHYLLASDFTGRICRWDMRMRRVIQEYEGHKGHHKIKPFFVQQDLGVLYAVGKDSCVRLWDVQSGALLKDLPPPYPAHVDHNPHVTLLPPCRKFPLGLLMVTQDEIHFYS